MNKYRDEIPTVIMIAFLLSVLYGLIMFWYTGDMRDLVDDCEIDMPYGDQCILIAVPVSHIYGAPTQEHISPSDD